MGISVGEGVRDLTNTAQDVLDAPGALLSGDTDGVKDAVMAPLEVKRGFLKTVLGAAAAPFRAVGLFGGNQSDPAVQQGTQAAVERYV
ncbi:MAG: hypothetical protein RMA76_39310 [Deltaproteobacteria bacterium]|jgi:hypothetical protein